MATTAKKKTKTHARTRAAGPLPRAADPARTWAAVPDPASGESEPIYVSFPGPPDADALAEAESYLAGLEARHQIARGPGTLAPGATHALEIDGHGRKKLVRRRVAARG